jgi:hypothetical protein
VVRIHAGGSPAGSAPLDATSFNRQDARLLPGERWFDPSRRSLAAAFPSTKECGERRECGALLGFGRQASFLGRLTAGSSALNRRMRGSNPARGALLRTRPWRPGGLQPRAGEGSIPSVRASSPGLLADRGCRPLKPAARVRIPLGALCCDDAAVVSTAACGRAMPAVRVRTPPAASTCCLLHRNHMRGSGANGNTRGLHP